MTKITKITSCLSDKDNTLTLAQAKQKCFYAIDKSLSIEKLSIRSALNRILAQEIIAPINVPAYANSAMDGYGLRKVDRQNCQSFEVIDIAYAGKCANKKIAKNQCIQIMTGAIMPENADMVIPQEFVTRKQDKISIEDYIGGDNVRFAGEDLAEDSIVFNKGHLLKAADLGLLASLGIAEIGVWRKLRIAFFSTGDELRSVATPLKKGEIYDSNRYSLFGMLSNLNVDFIDMGVIKDDYEALKSAFTQASHCADVILTTGGVSVGQADFVKQVLADIGKVEFWKLAIKPGRPLTFGKINEAYFFGLPGNPVAVMITFYQIVEPWMKQLMGNKTNIEPLLINAKTSTAIKKFTNRDEFLRARFVSDNGELSVTKLDKQGSGMLSSMSNANCLIVLANAMKSIKKGDIVQIQML